MNTLTRIVSGDREPEHQRQLGPLARSKLGLPATPAATTAATITSRLATSTWVRRFLRRISGLSIGRESPMREFGATIPRAMPEPGANP